MGCAGEATGAAATGALIGAGFGSVNAAWTAKPEMGTRTGPLLVNTLGKIGKWTGILAGVSAVYSGVKCTAIDVREKDDVISAFFGGCAAGATLAFKSLGGMAAMVKFAGEMRPESVTSTKYVDEVQKKLKEKVV